MGSFSWTRADKATSRKNLTGGDAYKILIPLDVEVELIDGEEEEDE